MIEMILGTIIGACELILSIPFLIAIIAIIIAIGIITVAVLIVLSPVIGIGYYLIKKYNYLTEKR